MASKPSPRGAQSKAGKSQSKDRAERIRDIIFEIRDEGPMSKEVPMDEEWLEDNESLDVIVPESVADTPRPKRRPARG